MKTFALVCRLVACSGLGIACSDSSGLPPEGFDADTSGSGSADAGVSMLRGTGGTSGMAAPPAASPDKLCDSLLKWCDKFNTCAPIFVKLVWGDVARCYERAKLSCLEDFKAPGTGLSVASVGTCVGALQTATCADLFANKIDACDIKGMLPDGAACGADSQCASARCRKDKATCGRCLAKSTAGGPCRKDENEDCGSGLVCNGQTCVAPAAGGAACNKGVPCAYGLYCTRAGACAQAANMPGQACTGEEGSCDFLTGLLCADKARVCMRIEVARPGEQCGLLRPAPTFCAFGDFEKMCKPDALAGVCAAPVEDGQPCGATSGPCIGPAVCTNGVCAIPSPASCK